MSFSCKPANTDSRTLEGEAISWFDFIGIDEMPDFLESLTLYAQKNALSHLWVSSLAGLDETLQQGIRGKTYVLGDRIPRNSGAKRTILSKNAIPVIRGYDKDARIISYSDLTREDDVRRVNGAKHAQLYSPHKIIAQLRLLTPAF